MGTYIPYGATIGGRQFRGSWKPYGYNIAPPTSEYKQPSSAYQYAGAAAGFGLEMYRNWGTIAAAGTAIGGAVGGAIAGPAGVVPGAMMAVI